LAGAHARIRQPQTREKHKLADERPEVAQRASLMFCILGRMATAHLPAAFLDDAQFMKRDAIVLEEPRKFGLTVAWNVASNCQEPLARLLGIHGRTMAACVVAYC